ncbi:MAG: hypothetical protein UY24_C0003G0002 [Parcubacteria group bacterium GW2011_GWA1_48_11b]|nr:MAG: hypothetical protein UY24_C0003G0002 [Parcubacteria group bacterium GW2011_GWA1_48_11b]
MALPQLSKLMTGVRFPLPAQFIKSLTSRDFMSPNNGESKGIPKT